MYRRDPCQPPDVLCHAELTTPSDQGLLYQSHERSENTSNRTSPIDKAMRRKWRRIRKGLADKQKEREGVFYETEAFGDDPGPSKRPKTM